MGDNDRGPEVLFKTCVAIKFVDDDERSVMCSITLIASLRPLLNLQHHIVLAYLVELYTVNHKKRDILFLTITLANLNRFL